MRLVFCVFAFIKATPNSQRIESDVTQQNLRINISQTFFKHFSNNCPVCYEAHKEHDSLQRGMIMKKLFNSKTLVRFVFCTFLASTVYIVIRLIMAPSGPASPEQDFVVKSDYALMLLQCVLGLAVMLLPGILQRKAKLAIPSGMVIAFAVFLFCAIYLGEVHYFYFRIPHWDTMLHTFSGFALGAIGLSIVGLLNKSESVPISLSPAFVAIFAFCFAVTIGVVWEIYEFTVDAAAGLNMQKYALESGEILVGHAALADTMKDLIVDSLGALAVSIVGYVSMKRKDGWLERMQIRRGFPMPVPQPVYAIKRQMPLVPKAQPVIVAAENSVIVENVRYAV